MKDVIKYYKLVKNFEEKWIALDEKRSKILASGDSIPEVEEKLKKTNKQADSITYVLPFDRYFAPHVFG